MRRMQNPPVPAHLETDGWFLTIMPGCTSFVGWADLKHGSHLWNRDNSLKKYAKEDKVSQEQADTGPGVWKPVQTKWDSGFVHGDPSEERTVVLDEGTLPLAGSKVTIDPKAVFSPGLFSSSSRADLRGSCQNSGPRFNLDICSLGF